MPKSRPKGPRNQLPVPALPNPADLQFSQALGCCLAILTSFGPDHSTRGIADLADDMGMHRSTIHRSVMILLALGYLEQNSARRYRLALRQPGSSHTSATRP